MRNTSTRTRTRRRRRLRRHVTTTPTDPSLRWISPPGPSARTAPHRTARRRDAGETPLTCAIGRQNAYLVCYFLDHGVDTEKLNSEGYTPLQFATDQGYVDIVELLLSKGANPNGLSHGGTALHVAANNGHDDIVKVLVDHHADDHVLGVMKQDMMLAQTRISWSTFGENDRDPEMITCNFKFIWRATGSHDPFLCNETILASFLKSIGNITSIFLKK